jgi:hypothetical protein
MKQSVSVFLRVKTMRCLAKLAVLAAQDDRQEADRVVVQPRLGVGFLQPM